MQAYLNGLVTSTTSQRASILIGQETDMELSTAVIQILGPHIVNDETKAEQVYAALCNMQWSHPDHGLQSVTWRTAGGIVDEIMHPDSNDFLGYCNYYCSGNEGHVEDWIRETMAAAGWTPVPWDYGE
jgi:hypothetical protein